MATTPKTLLSGPTRPLGSPDIPQVFLPPHTNKGTYTPTLYGAASVHFRDRKRKIDEVRQVGFILALAANIRTIDWETAQTTRVTPAQLLKEAPIEAPFLPIPPRAMELQTFTRWAKSFDRWLARTQRLDVTVGEPPEQLSLAPKRGGVSVEIVAIAWDLV